MSSVFRILYTKKYQNTDFYIGIKYVMRKNLILTIHRYHMIFTYMYNCTES